MKQLLVEKRFHFGTLASGTPAAPHEKTLQDVHTHEQFFYWLKAPFLDALFVPEPGGEPLFLHGYNRVIGPARLRQVHMHCTRIATCTAYSLHCIYAAPGAHAPLPAPRQVRVAPESCDVPAMFSDMIDSCFAPYAFKHIATAPFGPEEVPNTWLGLGFGSAITPTPTLAVALTLTLTLTLTRRPTSGRTAR